MIINQNVVKMTLDQQSAVIRSWVNIYTVHRPVGQLYKEQKCFWSTYRTLNLVGELLKNVFFSPVLVSFPVAWQNPLRKATLGRKGFFGWQFQDPVRHGREVTAGHMTWTMRSSEHSVHARQLNSVHFLLCTPARAEPMKWCHPRSGWVFPVHEQPAANLI